MHFSSETFLGIQPIHLSLERKDTGREKFSSLSSRGSVYCTTFSKVSTQGVTQTVLFTPGFRTIGPISHSFMSGALLLPTTLPPHWGVITLLCGWSNMTRIIHTYY